MEAGRPVGRGVWSQQRGEWMSSGSVGGGSGGAMDDGRKQDAGFRCVILIFCPTERFSPLPTDSHIKKKTPLAPVELLYLISVCNPPLQIQHQPPSVYLDHNCVNKRSHSRQTVKQQPSTI